MLNLNNYNIIIYSKFKIKGLIMNTYFTLVKTYLNEGYQISLKLYGKLAYHTVKVLEHIRQDARLAGVTVVFANIPFLEVAVRVVGVFDRVIGDDAEWSQPALLTKSIGLLTLLIGMLAGMNAALAKGLKLPLNGLKMTAISTAACASYILFRLWLVKD